MKIFYHQDLDGICSAAIIAEYCGFYGLDHDHWKKDFKPINYGWKFPWDDIKPGELVYMVDFCLTPFSDMIKLHKLTDGNFIWIDHHKTAIDAEKAHSNPQIKGLRGLGKAGCELTWDYMSGPSPTKEEIPRVVHLLGRYDVWDHYDPEIVDFQYGMLAKNLNPTDYIWHAMLTYMSKEWIEEIISCGKMIRSWEDTKAKRYCESYGIEVFLHGCRAAAVNIGSVSSQFFEAFFSKEDYDIFISYVRLPSGRWTVSLRSNRSEIDVSVIAKTYGGGGHPGAAGFQCETLPFQI